MVEVVIVLASRLEGPSTANEVYLIYNMRFM